MNSNFVIVGGGLSSLMVATKLKKDHPSCNLTIIEREKELGGMYKSFDYGKFGHFDHGMHIFYESCIPEIDDILIDSIGKDEWNFWEGNRKDIAGLYYNGKMQKNSPYVDMRSFDEATQKNALADFFFNLKSNTPEVKESALAYLTSRFGHTIATEVFTPILKKFYLMDSAQLDVLALKLITATDRVIFFDESQMLDIMKSDLIRSRLAFPEQMNLPLTYRSNKQRSFYPKKFGMFRVIEGFREKLQKQGVNFILGANITSLVLKDNKIEGIHLKKNNDEIQIGQISQLIWSAGLVPLSFALGLKFKLPPVIKKPPTYYVNLIFNKKVKMDELYYLYCYQSEFSTFRITNYSNFCPNAFNPEIGQPICVEFWPNLAEGMTEEKIQSEVLKELTIFDVIDDTYELTFSKVEPVHAGFPTPTIESTKAINNLREAIKEEKISNLINIGILAEENVFFFKDVLIDGFSKIKGL